MHWCTESVAIDEEQQNVRVAAALGQHDVIAAWQPGRRLKIHCVDATKERPLIRRDLDQFAALTFDFSAHRREIDGTAGEELCGKVGDGVNQRRI